MTERERKLLSLALNPEAKDGEVTNAAVALIRSWRDRKLTPESIVQAEARDAPDPEQRLYTQPDYGLCTMPFGKHRGEAMYSIPPDYLRFILSWIRESSERRAKWFSLSETIHHFLSQDQEQ